MPCRPSERETLNSSSCIELSNGKERKTEECLVLTLYQFCSKNLEVTMTSPLKRLTVSVSIFFCNMLISFLSCSWTVTCWASWLLCKSCKFLVWSSSSWRTLLSLWLCTMRCCWKSFCCCLYRFLGQNCKIDIGTTLIDCKSLNPNTNRP